MKQYLFDNEFLKKLDYNREKQIYTRIISLTNDEYPREQIEGYVTGGSINVDGASAVRRSCSLNVNALETNTAFTDEFWCYNNKFKLEIGLKNSVDKKYPDIIWFDMGIYIITGFSKSKNTNNFSISISGKDKMCRLNGEVSGNIMMTTDFGTIEEATKVNNEYQISLTKLPIYTIIQNAIKEYAQEKPENIIINDLDQYGYELWEYRGDEPMYLFIDPNYENNGAAIINITFNGDTIIDIVDDGFYIPGYGGNYSEKLIHLKDLGTTGFDFKFFSMNTLDKDYNNDASQIYWGKILKSTDNAIEFENATKCYVAKIEYGETAGYHRIPLVYNNDLILNTGETVTSLLDKLKAMLGDFEYFYDLQGRFVFQKKNTYIQELFSPVDGELVTPIMYASQYSYKFEDEKLFTATSNSPNLNNLKNDFSIWGNRKSATGDDLPIHARYAIDKKPKKYISPWTEYKNLCFLSYEGAVLQGKDTEEKIQYANNNNIFIWNIHTLGYDRINSNNINSGAGMFKLKEFQSFYDLKNNNTDDPWIQVLYVKENNRYYPLFNYIQEEVYNGDGKFIFNPIVAQANGRDVTIYVLIDKTTNEFYNYAKSLYTNTPIKYSVSKYDWRELIYQMAIDFYAHNQESDYLIKIEEKNPEFIDGRTGYEQYYSDLQGFWRQLYNPNPSLYDLEQYGEYYDAKGSNGSGNDAYWNKKLHLDPNRFNFWFDFFDTEGDLGKYSINKIDKDTGIHSINIGARSKVINETSIKSIYFRETPEILFIVYPKEQLDDYNMAYMPIWIQDNMEQLFYRSSQGASAVSKANELIYQHTATVENISITSIPIYYLQPNTRIYIEGYGDYTVDKITYSLNYNGTMSLSGNKIMKQFY